MFLRIFKESIISAINALIGNKLRTILSLLGITIGIFTIILVFTVLDSLENDLRKSVQTLGDDIVYVSKWPWTTFGPGYPWWKYIQRPQPSYTELDDVLKRSYCAQSAAFVFSSTVTLKHESSSIENVEMKAVSQDYNLVRNFEIVDGRYMTEFESSGGKPVIVIGDDIVKAFFPSKSAIGQYIKLNGTKVMVIGVLKREGESGIGNSADGQVFVPINFAKNLFDLKVDQGENHLILVKTKTGISTDQLIDELTGVLRSLHKLKPKEEPDFALNQISLISNQFDQVFGVLSIVGWIIGGFSILVGGFGIANIMFVSVKERTNIIGIQKSLGAKNHFILTQFLSEAIFLCIIGGIIGLLFIYLLTLLFNHFAGTEFILTQSNIVLGLTVSVIIGLVSGFIPAYSAAKLDPVEAIRSN